jgi:hypothetical protein
MIVKQECFRTFEDFDKNPKFRKGSNNPGVYMWGFSLEKNDYTIPSSPVKFFPYYVGKVEKEKRGRQHYNLNLHAYLCVCAIKELL